MRGAEQKSPPVLSRSGSRAHEPPSAGAGRRVGPAPAEAMQVSIACTEHNLKSRNGEDRLLSKQSSAAPNAVSAARAKFRTVAIIARSLGTFTPQHHISLKESTAKQTGMKYRYASASGAAVGGGDPRVRPGGSPCFGCSIHNSGRWPWRSGGESQGGVRAVGRVRRASGLCAGNGLRAGSGQCAGSEWAVYRKDPPHSNRRGSETGAGHEVAPVGASLLCTANVLPGFWPAFSPCGSALRLLRRPLAVPWIWHLGSLWGNRRGSW